MQFTTCLSVCPSNCPSIHPFIPTSAHISICQSREYWRGKYHYTVHLLFVWFGLVCFANKNFQLAYSWFQTSQTGGQLYNDTSPFSIPWSIRLLIYKPECPPIHPSVHELVVHWLQCHDSPIVQHHYRVTCCVIIHNLKHFQCHSIHCNMCKKARRHVESPVATQPSWAQCYKTF
jgi:hypothetical protein